MSPYFSESVGLGFHLALRFSPPTCPLLSTNCLQTARPLAFRLLSSRHGGSRMTCLTVEVGAEGRRRWAQDKPEDTFLSQASTPKLYEGLFIGVRMNASQRKHMGTQKKKEKEIQARSLARRNAEGQGGRLPREQGRLSG